MSYRIVSQGDRAELTLYGDIGWWPNNAAQFQQDLTATGKQPLLVRIHSDGGTVGDSSAIYTMLASRGNVTTRIDGFGLSAASLIAQAGNPRQIVSNGWLMVHEPSAVGVTGPEQVLRSAADGLSALKSSMTATYAQRTGKSIAEIAGLMAAETWYTAKAAKDAGFVDEIVEPFTVVASARFSPEILNRFRNVPEPCLAAWGLPSQQPNNDTHVMSKLSEIIASLTGPREREQKLVAVLKKANIDPDDLLASGEEDALDKFLASLINAAVGTALAGEKAKLAERDAQIAKISVALKGAGLDLDVSKIEELNASIETRIETGASRKLATMAAARGIKPVATDPKHSQASFAPKTLTQQCLEAKALAS